MNDREVQSVEAILARYRPVEAPADLLERVEHAALRHGHTPSKSLIVGLSTAAEIMLGLVVRGLAIATTAIVLLLVSAKGS